MEKQVSEQQNHRKRDGVLLGGDGRAIERQNSRRDRPGNFSAPAIEKEAPGSEEESSPHAFAALGYVGDCFGLHGMEQKHRAAERAEDGALRVGSVCELQDLANYKEQEP